MQFKSGDEVQFWLYGDPLTVHLHEGVWKLAWRKKTVQHERVDHALGLLLGRPSGAVIPLMIQLLREPPGSTIE